MAGRRGQPDVRITVHRLFGEPRDFTLSYPLAPELHEMLATIHREFGGRGGSEGQVIEDRMHPRLPRATHGKPGGWLTIASIRDPDRGVGARRWRLGHWPGSGLAGTHDVPSKMSIDHLEGQEYVELRIDEHGDGVRGGTEKSVAKGTRSDVVAFDQVGAPLATFEIQYAGQSEGLAVRRDRAVERAGLPATWFGPTDSRPAWAAKVAWLGANRREGMARGQWSVASGQVELQMEWCGPGSRQDCPFGRSWCYQKHPLWWPLVGTVDKIVDGIISRDLRRFDNGKTTGRRLVVATPADCQRWIDYFGAPKVARRAEQANRRHATTTPVLHNAAYSEAKILAGMRPGSDREPPVCVRCSDAKWSAVAEGVCLECRLDAAVESAALGLRPARKALPVPAPRAAAVQPEERVDRALRVARQAAIDMTGSMRTYEDLLRLWRTAERVDSATPALLEACRRRKAELVGGGTDGS